MTAGRSMQKINIFSVRKEPSRPKRPWRVRWSVDGRPKTRSFRTKAEAERFRSQLLRAQQEGERFSPRTGEPESWSSQGADMGFHTWARRWLAEQWAELQPHTRREDTYSLARYIPYLVDETAPDVPETLRAYLVETLTPDVVVDLENEEERWLDRWVLSLGELNREVLAQANHQVGLGDDGQTLAHETAKRYRRVARTCIARAVALELLLNDPWPPTPRGRSNRKAVREDKAVDVKRLHGPGAVARVLRNLANHRPESTQWQVMTAVVFYGGLRPGEVQYLRRNDLYLPREGWGHLVVDEADDGEGGAAQPKNSIQRTVPIPPVLVSLLQRWVNERQVGPDDVLFLTRHGNLPSRTNWSRALQLAHQKTGVHHIAVYDYRHACATLWVRAGMALPEAARRLGHSVDTLVATYLNAMEGDVEAGNRCVDAALEGRGDISGGDEADDDSSDAEDGPEDQDRA